MTEESVLISEVFSFQEANVDKWDDYKVSSFQGVLIRGVPLCREKPAYGRPHPVISPTHVIAIVTSVFVYFMSGCC